MSPRAFLRVAPLSARATPQIPYCSTALAAPTSSATGMFDPALDPLPETMRVTVRLFHQALVKRAGGKDANPRLVVYTRFAMLLGAELKRARQRVRAGRPLGAAPPGAAAPDGDLAMTASVDKMLDESFNIVQTRSGASDKAQRGIGPFLNTLVLIALECPSVMTERRLGQALQPLARFTGRTYLRGQVLEQVVKVGFAAAHSARVADKREGVFCAFARYLPLLLQARVSSRARGASVQFRTLQLLRALLPVLRASDVAGLFDASQAHALNRLFPAHPSRKCREIFYDICESVWDARLAPEPGESAATESLSKGMADDEDDRDSAAEGEDDEEDVLDEDFAGGSDGAAPGEGDAAPGAGAGAGGGTGAGAGAGAGPRLKRRRRPEGEESSGAAGVGASCAIGYARASDSRSSTASLTATAACARAPTLSGTARSASHPRYPCAWCSSCASSLTRAAARRGPGCTTQRRCCWRWRRAATRRPSTTTGRSSRMRSATAASSRS